MSGTISLLGFTALKQHFFSSWLIISLIFTIIGNTYNPINLIDLNYI